MLIILQIYIWLRGLREGIEGEELFQYLEEVFTGCWEADTEIVIWIASAYRLGPFRKTKKIPRDVLVRFPDWHTKRAVLNIFRKQQGLEIESFQISIYSDLSIITIRKQKNFKFVTSGLIQHKISYR